MRDFAGHQELKRVNRAGIVSVVDEAFVDNLGAGFGGNIAAQVHVEFAGDLQVVGSPRIAARVEQRHSAASGDGHKRIGLGGF